MQQLIPQRLGANQVPVYYAGGPRIDRFRGTTEHGGPEDWVGSVTAFPAQLLPAGADPEIGVSRLPDGSSLRAAVAADPQRWLGPALAQRFGTEPGLLVKLLDAGERLPVHCHPTQPFARQHLHSRFGKSEGWLLLDVEPEAGMWLGFKRDIARTELERWIETQDVTSMLEDMNRLDVQAGDVLFVPAGTPHAFGPGILLVELQEPTSFSILAEYTIFGLQAEQATLGLGWETALQCFDLHARTEQGLAALRPAPELLHNGSEGRVWRLFAAETEPFFQAYRVTAHGTLETEVLRGFSVLVVVRGAGNLRWRNGTGALSGGQTWVVPYAAGPLRLEGELELLVCQPPAVTT